MADIRERSAVKQTPRPSDIGLDIVGRCAVSSTADKPINKPPLDRGYRLATLTAKDDFPKGLRHRRGHGICDHLQDIALCYATPIPVGGETLDTGDLIDGQNRRISCRYWIEAVRSVEVSRRWALPGGPGNRGDRLIYRTDPASTANGPRVNITILQ